MVEQYVIEEIKKLKEENEKLKEELNNEKNKLVVSVECEPYYIELLDKQLIIEKLTANNIDPIKMYEECNTDYYVETIKNLKLYKDRFKTGKNKVICYVKYNKKYYEMVEYYNDYKISDEVYIDLDKAIYYELTDELYDLLGDYKRKIEKEKKESEKNNE